MQKLGTSHNTDNQSSPTPQQNRRKFALFGGIIGLVALLVYFAISAFPTRLFSEGRSSDSSNRSSESAIKRPELPASPLKSATGQVFASTTRVMEQQFEKMGRHYTAPSLQLFEDTITAYQCGQLLPATGAFYCPADKEVFIDLSFFRALKKVDSSSASKAQAYLIAHQVGHHIENLLGITTKLNMLRKTLSDTSMKKLDAKAELLADYYAGVWASYAFKNKFDDSDADILIADAASVCSSLAQNPEISVADPYQYADLGRRSAAFYSGYRNANLSKAKVFDVGELR